MDSVISNNSKADCWEFSITHGWVLTQWTCEGTPLPEDFSMSYLEAFLEEQSEYMSSLPSENEVKAAAKEFIWNMTTYSSYSLILQAINLCLTIPSLVINSFFLKMIVGNEEFRKPSFYPVALLATVGILEEVCSIYTIILFFANDMNPYSNQYNWQGPLSNFLRKLQNSKIEQYVYCIFVFLRRNLSKYTFGISSVSLALERFLAVCKPFEYKTYQNASWDKKQFLLVTMVMLIPLTIELGVKLYLNSKSENPAFHCHVEMDRLTALNHWIGFILFFITPAIVCGCLHWGTVEGLKSMKSNEKQNRSLTYAIIGSWLAWIVLCLPEYIVFSLETILNKFYGKLLLAETVAMMARMMYMQISPVLMMAIYAPFRRHISKVILNLSCFYRNDSSSQKTINIPQALNSNQAARFSESDKNRDETLTKERAKQLKILTGIVGLCLFMAVVSLIPATLNYNDSSDIATQLEELKKRLREPVPNVIKLRQSIMDNPVSLAMDPRINCRDSRGSLNWKFKRCLIFKSDLSERNFDGQKSECKNSQTHLAYPRTMAESDFIRGYFEWNRKQIEHCSDLASHLPIGYEVDFYHKTKSVDGKFHIIETEVSGEIERHKNDDSELARLQTPGAMLKSFFQLTPGYDILCYRKQDRYFEYCSRESTRLCHVCAYYI